MTGSAVDVPLTNNGFCQSFLRLRTLLIIGGAAHVLATVLIFAVGASTLFPNWIGREGTLREDSTRYLAAIETHSAELAAGDLEFLITAPEQWHLRVYSVAHFLTSGITGNNILAFELVNLPLFLAILLLVYKIAEVLFDQQIGVLSGFAAMCLPSFVLHTTQPLRDTIFLAVFLFLLFQLVFLFDKILNISSAIFFGAIGILNFLLLWFVRDSMWIVYVGILFTAFGLLLFKNITNEWRFRFNLLPAVSILLVSVVTPTLLGGVVPGKRDVDPGIKPKIDAYAKRQKELGYPEYLVKVNSIRFGFSESYREAGSNIDADYLFEDTLALIRYIPKAVAIGLLAPFPNSWLGTGVEFGKTGRLIAGAETLVMYCVMLLVVVGIFRNRRIPIAFLVLSVLIGTTALGLVVINVGAIYRLRYIFWMLLIILGIKGAVDLWMIRSAVRVSSESQR